MTHYKIVVKTVAVAATNAAAGAAEEAAAAISEELWTPKFVVVAVAQFCHRFITNQRQPRARLNQFKSLVNFHQMLAFIIYAVSTDYSRDVVQLDGFMT